MAFIEVMPVAGGKHLINTKYIVFIEEDNLSGCIIHLKYGAEGGALKSVHTKVSLASVSSDICKTAVSAVN